MRNLAVLFIHFIAVLARLLGPGGVRSVVAESLLLKHQILIPNGCLTFQILGITAVSGQPGNTSEEIIRCLRSQLQVLVR